MAGKGLRELYIDELKDLYNAENQLVKAFPRSPKLRRLKSYAPALRSTWNKQKGMWNGSRRSLSSLKRAPKERSARAWKV